MATVRTFLALDLSGGVIAEAQRLIKQLAAADGPMVRWVDPMHMHITMKFFGDIAPELTSDICRRVQPILDEWAPIEFEVAGVGAFPHVEKPRTIWAGVSAGNEKLVELAEQIEESVEPLGFRPERRRFRPHLTLGRVKGGSMESLATAIKALDEGHVFGATIADELRLLSSELRKSGPIYECMATLEFGK